MINPYFGAIEDMLDQPEVSKYLRDLLPSKIAIPIGYTYKGVFEFSQALIEPQSEKDFFVPR